LYYNDGRPIEAGKFQDLQNALLNQFRGLTFFPQPNKGFWKMADVTYRDEIVVYRVISTDASHARRFFFDLKERLKKELDQHEILIVERDIKTL
jgi:hypothetical protein